MKYKYDGEPPFPLMLGLLMVLHVYSSWKFACFTWSNPDSSIVLMTRHGHCTHKVNMKRLYDLYPSLSVYMLELFE